MLTGGTTINKVLKAASSTTHQDASEEAEFQWRQWAFCWASTRVQREVADKTWQAFWLTAVDNQPSADVASQLGLSIGAVYAAKCRVLQRMRDSVREIDNSHAIAQDIDSSEVRNEEL